MNQFDFDIGIIGGGPGGAATASYLQKAGLTCVVFEQEHFPRHHIGEALVPASNRVFQDLGLAEKMDETFRHKYGLALAGPWFPTAYVKYEEHPKPGVEAAHTFHVQRHEFDTMMLQRAEELGAAVYEGARVRNVDFSEPDRPRINYVTSMRERSVNVRMVVDASGRKTLLGNQLKLRVRDEVFDQYAIYTWFEGYERRALVNFEDVYQDEFTFIYYIPVSDSWIWQIPLSNTLTSIGVVTQKKNVAHTRQEREAFFWRCVDMNPQLAQALSTARQVRPFQDEGDYSYAMQQICGDNFLLVGDAARFVDPIFSTGVSIALNSARFASQDIVCAAEKGDFRKQNFQRFETTIRRGMQNWYDLISIYYRLNMVFSMFVANDHYRRQIVKLTQGDVYDEDSPDVIGAMKEFVREVEQNESHPCHPFLGRLTSTAFNPAF